ncbi:hypothetical protein BDQ12DRAFT_681931 [Crucibulum laeve]|uniref:Microbial-type PARG catalytic domain-containing protein n=1 Tax=Crucibulum laeve TaxID=68775 RepID=A0A5C3M6N5_9AGAR|nr:hypothetical protein BDQ12DRAFT_681931 [Crucibulum laeve]
MLSRLTNKLSGNTTTTVRATSLAGRQIIANDTVARSESIVAENLSEGASLDSIFIPKQLPALDASALPNSTYQPSDIAVVNSDSFTCARKVMEKYPEARGKTAVLNLASDERPAGGWIASLSRTQEEALCYSSTLYRTLKECYYPWPNVGPGSIAGVFSPGVVIFKDDLDHDCKDLTVEDRRVVSVITVAAPRWRKLTEDNESFQNPSDIDDLRGKIRLVYRMAARHGQQYLVLGAMGCGAYGCPPRFVAEEMKAILLEDEFKGWFKKVIFAVYSVRSNGVENYDIFKEIFKGVKV